MGHVLSQYGENYDSFPHGGLRGASPTKDILKAPPEGALYKKLWLSLTFAGNKEKLPG